MGAFSSDRDISQAHRQSREEPRGKTINSERHSEKKRGKSESRKEGGDVFIMSGIEMMPHWGLLVSLYIQWQPHQFPSEATMQSSQFTVTGIQCFFEENRHYPLHIQYNFTLDWVTLVLIDNKLQYIFWNKIHTITISLYSSRPLAFINRGWQACLVFFICLVILFLLKDTLVSRAKMLRRGDDTNKPSYS